MNLEHHLQTETLMAYAAGTLPAAMALVVSCHAEVCRQCRETLREAETLGGRMLESLEARPLPESARASVLAKLDDSPLSVAVPAPVESPMSAPVGSGALFPSRLKKLLKVERYDQLGWRKLAPGIEKFNLPLDEGRSFLLRIGAGLSMPVHRHKGSELTLLLQGGYHDALGNFHVGDVADLDASVEHQPIAFEDEPCICLAGMDAGLKFRSLIPTLMKPLTGL